MKQQPLHSRSLTTSYFTIPFPLGHGLTLCVNYHVILLLDLRRGRAYSSANGVSLIHLGLLQFKRVPLHRLQTHLPASRV